jgi:hypothetical protein
MIGVKTAATVAALLAAITLAGCGGDNPNGNADPTATVPTETPTETPTQTAEPVDEGEVFLTISARMTEVTGEQLSAELTIYEPTPEAESAELIDALDPDCVVFTSNRASDAAGSPEPAWFGAARLVVTGDDTWNDDHAVRILTGGYGNIGAGDASTFADNITCANLLHAAGTSTFATYFPLNYAEGGIEGALNWSIMGFSDLGDAAGVTYDQCAVELSAHAQALSPAESGWALRNDIGCVMAPLNLY